MRFYARFEKILPLIGNGIIPATIFAVALLSFYVCGAFSAAAAQTLHTVFFLVCIGSLLVLLYFNRSKPAFFLLAACLSYVLINFLKNKYGTDYLSAAAYQNLCFFLPLNLLLFYFIPERRLLKKINVYLLIAIFLQYALAEQLSNRGYALNFYMQNPLVFDMTFSGFAFFCLTFFIFLFRASLSGNITDYAALFASLSLFFGFACSSSASALTVFFAATAVILCVSLSLSLYNETYRDSLTGLAGRNSYIIHAKDFPLKYCLGIVSIDDFDKLGINFGRRAQNILTKLIAGQITELEAPETVYRYGNDEFVIIFKNLDKNESFERLEDIRRAIASAQFKFNPRRRPLKLTVSACVAEKKRSDANSFEVLVRARKTLEKTRSFSHNVTSKA